MPTRNSKNAAGDCVIGICQKALGAKLWCLGNNDDGRASAERRRGIALVRTTALPMNVLEDLDASGYHELLVTRSRRVPRSASGHIDLAQQ